MLHGVPPGRSCRTRPRSPPAPSLVRPGPVIVSAFSATGAPLRIPCRTAGDVMVVRGGPRNPGGKPKKRPRPVTRPGSGAYGSATDQYSDVTSYVQLPVPAVVSR